MPPINLLIKPASGNCNMRCNYCFYADEMEKRTIKSYGEMSLEMMYVLVDKTMQYASWECNFAFQGGEPTLIGLEFYKQFVARVKEHRNAKKMKVHFAIQTNGYALNEEWAKFLSENKFLVGVSLDGNKTIHDKYRYDSAGNGTYQKVMATIKLLEKYKVDYNILTVVTGSIARNGQKVYNFYKKNGFQYQQYIECLDPIGEIQGQQEYSLTPQRYESFLKSMFDMWYLDIKKGTYIYNRYFENLILMLAGKIPESCSMRGNCGKQWVIEADGSTYPCDFYVLDEWKLGDINHDTFEMMEKNRDELGFISMSERVVEECKGCKWFFLCRNGCRRHRKVEGNGVLGKNYYCSAYYHFFEYAYPRLIEIYQKGWIL